MLNSFSVKSRLGVMAILPVVIFLLVALFSLSIMRELTQGIDSLYNDRVVPLKQIKIVSDNYAVNTVDLLHKYRAGTISSEQVLSELGKASELADREWQAYLATKLTEREAELVTRTEAVLKPVKAKIAEYVQLIRNGELKKMDANKFVGDLYAHFDPLSASYADLIDLQLDEANKFKQQADANAERITTVMWAIIIALVLLMTGVAYVIYRSVQTPLLALRNIINDIAENADLRLRACVTGDDEIAETANGFNRMMERIHVLVKDVSGATLTLSSASEEMSAISEQVASTATQQEQQTAMIATAVTEMSAAIQEVASHALTTSQKAEEADQIAKQGHAAVGKNIDSIENLSRIVKDNAEIIHQLNVQSNDINQVVLMIQGVAEQTNLLALNAAIEAARAGDSGRGFAVVADEVRQLAHNTQKATETINEMITKLQAMAQQAVSSMEMAEHSAEQSVAHASDSSDRINEVNAAITEISDMNIQVSTATEEQTTVASEISHNINEFSSSIAMISQSSQQNADASRELSQLAVKLQNQVSQFSV